MRKISIYSAFIIVFLAIIFTVKNITNNGIGILLTVAMVGILFFSYFYFGKRPMGTKRIVLIAILGSLAAVFRIVFAIIPGVQPTTFMVALCGLVFGSYEGFLVGSMAAFISNTFLGQGPWTLWQMLAWGVIGGVSGLIGKSNLKISSGKFAIICFLFGILYGWIVNLWFVIGSLKVINIKTIIAVNLTSLISDMIHGGGNFIFCIIFFDRIYNLLSRFRHRFENTYIN